jgi:hypothetical protein
VVVDYSCNPLQTILSSIRVVSPPFDFGILPESVVLFLLKEDSDG